MKMQTISCPHSIEKASNPKGEKVLPHVPTSIRSLNGYQ
jgi:hypothetical protein